MLILVIKRNIKKLSGGYVMAYYIGEKCIKCGSCSFVCPVGAVDIKKRGGL